MGMGSKRRGSALLVVARDHVDAVRLTILTKKAIPLTA
jgi:hypothetical protein